MQRNFLYEMKLNQVKEYGLPLSFSIFCRRMFMRIKIEIESFFLIAIFSVSVPIFGSTLLLLSVRMLSEFKWTLEPATAIKEKKKKTLYKEWASAHSMNGNI